MASGGWKPASMRFPTNSMACSAMSLNGTIADGGVAASSRSRAAQSADERDQRHAAGRCDAGAADHLHGHGAASGCGRAGRSEEHTSELQSLMRISYAVFCLKKKTKTST